jgi:hypothetical protein
MFHTPQSTLSEGAHDLVGEAAKWSVDADVASAR